MDIAMLAPEVAKFLGVSPSTLVLLLLVATTVARAVSRAIPDDATGFAAFVRRLTAVVGVEVAAKVSSGVTVKDVARAAMEVPPIPAKVDAIAKEG